VAAGVDHLVGRRWQLGRGVDGFDQVVAQHRGAAQFAPRVVEACDTLGMADQQVDVAAQ
jgi:hypothetical protein